MTDQSSRPQILARDPDSRASTRLVPFPPVKVTATAPGAAQTVTTAGSAEIFELAGLKVTLHIVPAAASASDATIAINAATVPANGVLNLSDVLALGPGDRLMVEASAADDVRISGWSRARL